MHLAIPRVINKIREYFFKIIFTKCIIYFQGAKFDIHLHQMRCLEALGQWVNLYKIDYCFFSLN